ncbi:MAG: hypothetical protein [Microviridae sp.]|nr:MAG: hypothetical protein [Microviridae sp.]
MQSESLNGMQEETHNNASTSEKLTEQIAIQDTPFTAVRMDKKWFLALGRYRLSELLDTFTEVEAMVTEANYNLLTNMMYAIATDAIQEAAEAAKLTTNTMKGNGNE